MIMINSQRKRMILRIITYMSTLTASSGSRVTMVEHRINMYRDTGILKACVDRCIDPLC
jgi:hypothetical protein